MTTHIIGIDNGSTGAIAVYSRVDATITHFEPAKVTTELATGKTGRSVSRLDRGWLSNLLLGYPNATVFIEKPFMAGPMMMMTAIAAARFHEATLGCLEDAKLGYQVVASSEWQKALFGKDVKGADLKKASLARASQMWPAWATLFKKQKDGDAALIAYHYATRLGA